MTVAVSGEPTIYWVPKQPDGSETCSQRVAALASIIVANDGPLEDWRHLLPLCGKQETCIWEFMPVVKAVNGEPYVQCGLQ
jgi:hypothetical protein